MNGKKKLFLSIGAMKAGTTWLYSILKHHEHLYFTPEKEVHFLNKFYCQSNVLSDEFRLTQAKKVLSNQQMKLPRYRYHARWYGLYLQPPLSLKWYHNVFSLNRRSDRWNCDFSNLTCHLNSGHWLDLEDQFDLKTIYILRSPIERLWSHLKFHLKFLGQEGVYKNWSKKQFRSFLDQKHVWENTLYSRNIKSLQNGLDASQYRIFYFEDIFDNPSKAIKTIESFLQIDHMDLNDFDLKKKVNSTDDQSIPDYFFSICKEKLEGEKQNLEKLNFWNPTWTW